MKKLITKSWLKLKTTFKKALFSGLSEKKISMAVSWGFFAGLFPIYGTHTPIAMGLGAIFRMNLVAVYVGLFISLPFFLVALLPSLRLGEFITGSEAIYWDAFYQQLKTLLTGQESFSQIMVTFAKPLFNLFIGWLPISILMTLPMYGITFYISRKLLLKRKLKINQEEDSMADVNE